MPPRFDAAGSTLRTRAISAGHDVAEVVAALRTEGQEQVAEIVGLTGAHGLKRSKQAESQPQNSSEA
jgi:hypothetical protein